MLENKERIVAIEILLKALAAMTAEAIQSKSIIEDYRTCEKLVN